MNRSAFEFDPTGFARTLRDARRRLGLSTRALAAAAGISQAYVVALEGAHRPDARRAVPTVDVITGLAAAIGCRPGELFDAAVRPRCRHVLLVVDGDAASAGAAARRACTDASVQWVRAVSSDERDRCAEWAISLGDRPDAGADTGYEPARIARALRDELARRPPDVASERLGVLFERSAAVMASLHDPDVIIDFEEDWSEVVRDAADASGAHVLWNVCVYERERLAALPDPVGASLRLLRSHDTVWHADATRTRVAGEAARRVLLDLRRPGTSARAWGDHVDQLLDSIGYAA